MTWFYSLFTLDLGLRSLHWEKKAPDKMQREAQEVLSFCSSLGTGPEDGRVVSGTVGNVFDHAWLWAHLSRARQGYCATVSTGLTTRRHWCQMSPSWGRSTTRHSLPVEQVVWFPLNREDGGSEARQAVSDRPGSNPWPSWRIWLCHRFLGRWHQITS